MNERLYSVYILASKRNGTLYTGVTNDLVRRTYEPREKLVAGFSKKYGVTMLVWHEEFSTIDLAIKREKRIKKYPRRWKLNLIEEKNPDWNDLWDQIY
ncbi:MAG: GIY-YIG nuclease family protein [Robiginitomaculum sp.]|nr:GIY-YIG nuclease family protein [Robiginitomaculum sp.]